MVSQPAPRRRTLATYAIAAVTLFALSNLVPTSYSSGRAPTVAPDAASGSPSDVGHIQLDAARHSLQPAPAVPSLRPGALPHLVSPGGYTWTNISGTVLGAPSTRIAASMTWDASDGYVLLYGGEGIPSTSILGDTWSYLNGTWTNLTATITGVPPTLFLTQMAFDPTSHEVIMFGGDIAAGVASAQTWAYHNRTWTNLTSTAGTPPSARVVQAMSTDSTDSEIVLFGGTPNGGGTWGTDTWTFKGGSWTNVTAAAGSSAGGLLYPVASDDPPDHGAVVIGLYSGGPSSLGTATLVYSGGSWRNVTSSLTHPPPRFYIGAAGYLSSISSVVAFSGIAVNRTGSMAITTLTGEYSPGSWTNVTGLTGGPPLLNIFASGSVVGPDQSMLAFGVFPLGSPYFSSSWLLSAPPKVTASANHLVVDQGTSVSFTGSVSLGAAPYTYHWSFG
ncbi:MAG: hypothetical protein L3K13_07310, partial [Thermoplasmata archaeon]|nr:hypothetical protein [Thermoplasmata archaeon]